jgi:type II secretory pathway component PulF
MALNDQLGAMIEACIPIDIGLPLSAEETPEMLDWINASVARRVSRGESLDQSLESDEQAIPATYRSLVRLGLYGGDMSAAIAASHRVAEFTDDSTHAVRSAFFYPMVVCCLAYFGMVGFCLFFVPTLENMYASLRLPPGARLNVLIAMRDWLPYWIAVPPIVLLIWWLWLFRTRRRTAPGSELDTRRPAWLPGVSRSVVQERCANLAEMLAKLLQQNVPLDESLRIASGACGDARLAAGADAIAEQLRCGVAPTEVDSADQCFPPFLRWAVLHSESIGHERALQMAARIYRESAERAAQRLRIFAPLVACVVVGGGVTLLYGLALFVPVVEMLRALAS